MRCNHCGKPMRNKKADYHYSGFKELCKECNDMTEISVFIAHRNN